jgi:hypothetical protein
MNSDLLDEYCENYFGHTDWSMDWDEAGNLIITFHKEPRPDYLADQHEEDCPTMDGFGCHCGDVKVKNHVRMRKDLAEEGISIPAGLSYKDYDDLQEITYLTAEDMEGAVEFDTGEDPDSHAFCPVKLADGRVFYMIGVDLDWFSEEEL